MKPTKKLGRGLDALFESSSTKTDSDSAATTEISLDKLQPSSLQPRKNFNQEDLEELSASIKQQGIIQPLVVRAKASLGEYEIIAGERRWRAAQLAGLNKAPVVVREATDQEVLALALVENLQRQDLNPLEEAKALEQLINDFGLSQQEVATLVGKARSSVSNLLRLTNLHPQVQTYVTNDQLDMGHARALLALPNPQQPNVAAQVITQELSVRQTEALVKSLAHPEKTTEPTKKERIQDPNIIKLEQNLAANLGAQVKITHSKQGKGKLEIRYANLEELDGILSRINRSSH